MLDRPSLPDAALAAAESAGHSRWPFAIMAWAGLLGAAGVGIGAAGAHMGGGDLTRIASDMLLVHAAALVGGGGAALALPHRSRLLATALALVGVGAPLFGGALALAGLWGWRPVPLAAPAGGLCLIAGWLVLAAAALALGTRHRAGRRDVGLGRRAGDD